MEISKPLHMKKNPQAQLDWATTKWMLQNYVWKSDLMKQSLLTKISKKSLGAKTNYEELFCKAEEEFHLSAGRWPRTDRPNQPEIYQNNIWSFGTARPEPRLQLNICGMIWTGLCTGDAFAIWHIWRSFIHVKMLNLTSKDSAVVNSNCASKKVLVRSGCIYITRLLYVSFPL